MPQLRPTRGAWRCLVGIAAAAAWTPSTARAQLASFQGEHTATTTTLGTGAYADGEEWFVEDSGSFTIGPFHARAQTSAALPDNLIRGGAAVEAAISADSISLSASAQAFVGPGMVVDSLLSSASMVVRITIAEDTPFFIRRSGTLPASLTPVTGAIQGSTLRAGTYDLAGFAWASRRTPGTINLTGSYTIILADCIPDWNNDAVIGSSDVSAFVADWTREVLQGGTTTDVDGSGQVTSADISRFLGLWLAASAWGC